jgi:hypothetical protein
LAGFIDRLHSSICFLSRFPGGSTEGFVLGFAGGYLYLFSPYFIHNIPDLLTIQEWRILSNFDCGSDSNYGFYGNVYTAHNSTFQHK